MLAYKLAFSVNFGINNAIVPDVRRLIPMRLDAIDQRILRVLQRDGRCPNNELAREVGLSPSPCLRRVRLLEEAGVIER